jgi:glycosyltransferase involved in cell wall biosynthesis
VNRLPKILIFAPNATGGLAEYTFYQASALEKTGAKVICLTSDSFLAGRRTSFERIICLSDCPIGKGSRLLRRVKMAWQIILDQLLLAGKILEHRPDLVLLDSYMEYLSPIWIWPHWFLAKLCRVHYAANLHDPVRSFAIGPIWWHKLSVRLAYLPLDFVLVHENLAEPSPVPAEVRVVQVPHGLYEISSPSASASEIRQSWGVKAGQKVFLAFGFVRDGKNLDLVLRALVNVPEVFLVVAGAVASNKDKSFAFYRELAAGLGVADRCRFFEGFVADDDLGKFFAGTDFVLLTYASTFHSQSGVLNIAARARKPVLASAAPSALIQSVEKFALGLVVAPDSAEAIASGMRGLIDATLQPRWDDYEAAAAWAVNARGVLEAAGFASGTSMEPL